MKFLTWNVHSFVGRDGKADPKRVADVIADYDPDVTVLQEVDFRDLDPVALDTLRRSTDIHAVSAPAMGDGAAWYGQILFSQVPILTQKVHDISVPGREPRRLLEAVLQTALGELRILAVHLGLGRRERKWQFARIKEIVDLRHGTPTVLAGDMNEWVPAPRLARRLLGPDSAATSAGLRTFPAHMPLFPLDRVMTAPAQLLGEYRVGRHFRRISDHLPLMATLNVP